MNAQSKYTQGRPLPLEGETPVLHLSGPALTLALEAATTGAEALGGIALGLAGLALIITLLVRYFDEHRKAAKETP